MASVAIKKKRVSKKKKIAWRKHVDISDVDAFLEDQRLEERIGKPLSLFKDEELFCVDVKPSNEPKPSSKKEKRLKLLQTEAKCFAMLKPHTNVPDPIAKRNRVRTKEERKNELLKRKEERMRREGILKAKEKQAAKDRKFALDKKAALSEEKYNDIWAEEAKPQMEWAQTNTIKHINESLGNVHKKLPKALKAKRSVLPAVEPPHPGTSYNPSFEDHKDLLDKIIEKEKKIIKEEEHLNRVTRDMFRKVSEKERDASYMKEMAEGLPNIETDVKDENSDSEYQPLNPPVENKKKTLQQRRKHKEHMNQERIRKLAKLEKKKVADIYKLRFINKSLETHAKNVQLLQEKRVKTEERKTKEARRLGPLKFKEPDVDFNMGADITGNLRNMKKEGNLLTDRFKSLQKRNILEVTARRNVKRAKIKRFTKPDHKDNWKSTVARAKVN